MLVQSYCSHVCRCEAAASDERRAAYSDGPASSATSNRTCLHNSTSASNILVVTYIFQSDKSMN